MSLMRNNLMVAAVLGLAGSATAGTIVQPVSFSLGGDGNAAGVFQKFSPSLGALNAVQVDLRATGRSDNYTFTNPTAATISFSITARDALFADALPPNLLDVSLRTFAMTLGPFRSDTLLYAIAPPSSPVAATALLSAARGDFLGNYVGTSPMGANAGAYEYVTVDDPAILVRSHGVANQGDPEYSGRVTVTYYYGPTLGPAPEPASAVLLGLGLACVAAARAIRRRSPASGRRP